jgi:hypothetical protein
MSVQYPQKQFIPSDIDQIMYDSLAKSDNRVAEEHLRKMDIEWASMGEP